MAQKKNITAKNTAAKKSTDTEKNTKQKQENLRLKEEIRTLKKNRDIENTFTYNFMPYILCFVGVFLAVCFVIPDKMSFLGYLSHFLCGLFSAGAAFLPICLVIQAMLWKRDIKASRLQSKIFINTGFVFTVSALCQLVYLYADRERFSTYNLFVGENSLYAMGKSYHGGGIVGGVIANFLDMITGVGAWIICIFLLFLLAFAIFNITPVDIVAFVCAKTREWAYNARVKRKENLKHRIDEQQNAYAASRHEPDDNSAAAASETGRKRKKAYLGGIGEPENGETADSPEEAPKELPPLDISPDAVRMATGDMAAAANAFATAKPAGAVPALDGELPDSPAGGSSEDEEIYAPDRKAFDQIKEEVRFVKNEDGAAAADHVKEIDLAEIFAEGAEIASAGVKASTSDVLADGANASAATEIRTDDELEGEKEDVKVAPKPNLAELYRFPDIEFLQKDPNPATFTVNDEIKNTSVKLVETLANFGVKTKITNICCGPTVTRYELQPEIGVRVKSIQNLSDDIALHLAAAGVRIEAPIPGKQAVGIEIPNKTVSTVYIRNLIENPKFAQLKSRLSVSLGMDVAGSPVYMDIAKMPHLLIAGATGMGKSVCINSFIVSLLYKARPDECKLLLIDPKKVEFGVYNGMPHLLVPVVSDPKKAAGSLAWAVGEMERRFQLIEEVGVRDIDSYNKTTENDPEKEYMPKIVIIIDELADLMMTARDSVESSICRIAQKARAAGMHLVIGTQRPSVDVITGLIKANVPSRIACTVASQVDSRTIIDIAGAEKLLGRGDMLYAPVGCMKPVRVQGSFVTDGEIEKIIDFLKSGSEAEYDSDIIDSIEREAEHCGEKKKGRGGGDDGSSEDYDADDRDAILDSDDAIFDAIKVAVDANMISTSLLQRKLSLGYSRAARIVDKLEKLGIVGPFEGSKPRKVLITAQEYLDLKLNHSR